MMLAKGASQAVSWLVTLVVIRILTPADYGLYAMAAMLVILAEMLKELGLGTALVQARELTSMMIRQVYTLVLLSNVILYFIIVAMAPVMVDIFSEDALGLLIPVLALQFPIMAFETVPEALLSRAMNFRAKALIAMIGALASSAVTLSCALLGMGVWSLVFGMLVASVVRVICYGFVERLYHGPTLNFRGVAELATFGGYVTLSRFLNVLLVQSSFFVVGRVLGKEALGVFTVANQLATLPMQKVSGILNEVGLAAFSRIQDDRRHVAAQYTRAMAILAFISFPVFWGIASVAEGLTEVVLGEKWLAVVLPLQLIALVTPLRMVFNTTTPALLGIGRADVFFTNLLLLNVVMPLACLAGTPWGVDGASMAWLLAYPPLFLLTQQRSLRQLDVRARELLNAVKASAAISFGMLVVVLGSDELILEDRLPEIPALLLSIAIGAAFYALVSRKFNSEQFRESAALILK